MPQQSSLATRSTPQHPNVEPAIEWGLDPTIDFLNHGSFGARPRAIMLAQAAYREQYESRPIEWLNRRRHSMLQEARRVICPFIGASPTNFSFVTNATSGINAVLRSQIFKPGDELLTTTHVYNAVRMTMRHLAERAGAGYREIDVPLPVRSPDEITDKIAQAITPRTRLLVIDHITSPTAVIFPVQDILALCERHGIDVIIDGAHAPGMLFLDVEKLNPAYYAANLHKWVCAPSGAGFLWVRPDRQKGIHPATISHFLDQGLTAEFDWQGTRDITPWLAAKDAVEFFGRIGWDRVMRHNHELAVWVQQLLCEAWRVESATPLDGSMIGSMATVPLPGLELLRATYNKAEVLQAALYDRFRIEVPVIDWGNRWWVRPCCQLYNQPVQYERLADAVLTLMESGA